MISGYPISAPSSITPSTVTTGSVAPGMIGTPAAAITARASVFEPINSIAAGGGPIHVRPASSTDRANAAFSARNP